MDAIHIILAVALGAFIGISIYLWKKSQSIVEPKQIELSEEEAIEKASSKASKLIAEANEKASNIRKESEISAKNLVIDLDEREKRLNERERGIIDRGDKLDKRFDSLEVKEEELEIEREAFKKRKDELEHKLEEVAGYTREEAKTKLMDEVEKDLKKDIAKRLREAEELIRAKSDVYSREILVDAMQKSATDYVAETTVTTLEIPNDDMKGRIIGKEGRNIKALEKYTGVDVIVDDVPGMITISCFDPLRREVASLAIQKLLKDGRVHPGTIEETVHKIKVDMAKEIKKTGEQVAFEAGFPNLPEDIIKLLGRFKYRYSYGQNLIKHSMEVVNLGSVIASEVGADAELTKLACLLHDLGKVLTHEQEGKPHHHISGDIVRKHNMGEKLANAVESHHGDIEPKSIEAVIVYIADAISGARPGARRDNYEDYVKRIRALEDIANSYSGVKESYAIHAGREVRVIVKSNETTDEDTKILAQKIAQEIEKSQSYPGQVKINVIREVRSTSTAK